MFDAGATAIARLTAGEPVDAAFLDGNGGLAPPFRALHDAVAAVCHERDEEAEAHAFFEGKLKGVARAIDSYRSAATRMGELTSSTRGGLAIATEAFVRARKKSRGVRQGEEKRWRFGRAEAGIGRAQRQIGSVDARPRRSTSSSSPSRT